MPPTVSTSPPAPIAGEASDDDVEAGDDAVDDGHEDGADAIDDGHYAPADGLEDRFDLEVWMGISLGGLVRGGFWNEDVEKWRSGKGRVKQRMGLALAGKSGKEGKDIRRIRRHPFWRVVDGVCWS